MKKVLLILFIPLLFSCTTQKYLKRISISLSNLERMYTDSRGEYQVYVSDSIYVWDQGRWVGQIPWSNGKFDSLILKDNQLDHPCNQP